MNAASRCLATALAFAPAVAAQGLTLEGRVFAGGGITSATAPSGLELAGTLGEGAVGVGVAANLWLVAGFWSGVDPAPAGAGISALRAIPGPAQVRLGWRSSRQDGLLGYVVERRTGTGPFAPVGAVPFTASGEYDLLDGGALPRTVHTYLVSESLPGGLFVPRSMVDGVAYGTALPPNVARVGSGGSADIQAAIAAAPSGAVEWVVAVQPGTYPAFTVDATAPAHLRVIGDGTGPVAIDTSAGSVRILARGPGQTVELNGLTIGAAATRQTGVLIDGALGVVLLDRVQVMAAPTATAVHVRASRAVAVQRSTVDAGTGLRLDSARVVATRSAATGIDLSNSSRLTVVEVANTGASTVDPTSVFETLPGTAPDVATPVFAVPGVPAPMEVVATPHSPFTCFVSVGHGFLEFPPIQLPVLMDLSLMIDAAAGATDGSGRASFPMQIGATSTALFGQSLTFQLLTIDPATATIRMSTVTTKVWLP